MSAGTSGPGRRFNLLELIGRGSYGAVYLAEQHSGAGFRKKVALKLLNDEVARMPSAGRRMRDEARVLGLLSHRHIVAVHDLVRVDDRYAILMEWVPGADLEHLIEALQVIGATMPVGASLEVGSAIYDALDFAASAIDGDGGPLGVIHRDIKPGNIRLSVDGDVKVLDFGGARFSLDARETATGSGAWIGTERYMAPERLLQQGDTAAGDVYATAATVIELILGRPLGRTPLDPVGHQAMIDECLALVRARIDATPDTVDRVIAALGGALSHDASLRPSARDLRFELEKLASLVGGPTLQQFAREFVSRIDEILGRFPLPVSGTLVEGATELEVVANSVEGSLPAPQPTARHRLLPILALTAAIAGAFGAVVLGVAAVAVGGEVARREGAPRVPAKIEELSPDPVVLGFASDAPPEPRAPVRIERRVAPEVVPPAVPVRPKRPAPPRPRPAPSVQEPVAEVAAERPRIDRTVVALKDASRIEVTCRDVSASGTASVRIMDFPAGPCTVAAEWLGTDYSTQITVHEAASWLCRVQDGSLQCS
jgi:eukaryotic-like serine/threonine-protein kinase